MRIIVYQKCTHTLLAIGLSVRRVLFKPFIAALSNKLVTRKNFISEIDREIGNLPAAAAVYAI